MRSRAHFKAECLAIKIKDQAGVELTDAEKLIASHPERVQRVRNALRQQRQAMRFVRMVDDITLPRMPTSFNMKEIEKLSIVKYLPLRKIFVKAPFLKAFPTTIFERSIIITGPPQAGKTPLALACGLAVTESQHQPWFPVTSTVDSLRYCAEQDLFLPCVPIIIDEWNIGKSSQDQEAHKAAFIKTVTDVTNSGTAHARYSDIKFPVNTPRIITSNETFAEWLQRIKSFPPLGYEAILKRCAWVEDQTSLMDSAKVEEYKESLQQDGTTPLVQMMKEQNWYGGDHENKDWETVTNVVVANSRDIVADMVSEMFG